MTREEFLVYITINNKGFRKQSEGHIRKYFPDFYKEILDWIKFHDLQPLNFNDGLKYFLNNKTTQNKCLICGKNIYYNNQYCSNICKKQDIQNLLDRTTRKTLFEKNGTTSPLGSKEAKQKFKNTCKEHFGYENPFLSPEIKQKSLDTLMENYNVTNPSFSPIVKEKISNSLNELHSDEVRHQALFDKIRKTNEKNCGEYTTFTKQMQKKCKQTMLNLYEHEYPLQVEQFVEKYKETIYNKTEEEKLITKEKTRLTCLKNFNADCPSHNPEIVKKQQINGFKSRYYKDTNILYRGSYELDFLNKYYTKFPDLINGPIINYLWIDNKFHVYYPDFYIPSLNLIIEIKSLYYYKLYRDKCEIKRFSTILQGYNYLFIIDKTYNEFQKLIN